MAIASDDESSIPDVPQLAVKQTILSSRRLLQFMGPPKTPPQNAKIIYTDGSFDVFHSKKLIQN